MAGYTKAEIISIHALLAESDGQEGRGMRLPVPISIHALLAESDMSSLMNAWRLMLFLSTLSLRRATSRSWLGRRLL